MTPDMRQTLEVAFARDVARYVPYLDLDRTCAIYICVSEALFCSCRACRTGNFIAFFNLSQKASYLQACLMHAHFAKVSSITAYASIEYSLSCHSYLP